MTVTLETVNSSITYDLGEPTDVSAVVMQGDANDTYKVMGSVDGSPASYKLLVELPNVVDRGHGLRTRSNQFPPTKVRYLRIGDANGDNSSRSPSSPPTARRRRRSRPDSRSSTWHRPRTPTRRRRRRPAPTRAAGRCC